MLGDLRDDVVEALDVLDVERGVDVDAGGEQLLDIEIALGMAASGALVCASSSTSTSFGPAREDRVEIHLLENVILVLDTAARNDFETLRATPRFRRGRWVSTTPTTTSMPSTRAVWAAVSIS